MIIDSHEHIMLPTDTQLKKMKEAGVDKTILFCSAPHPERANTLSELKQEMSALYKVLAGENSKKANIQRMKKNIAELTAVLNAYPDQFYGFGSVPLELSIEETEQWIDEYIVSNDLKGVGEFTPGSVEQVRQLETVFQALEKFPQLPIWIHTFHPVALDGIKILMYLAKKYPQVPVIFGHMGGYYWMEAIETAKETTNVYLDLSGTFSSLAVRIAVAELPDRCLFSSDAPYGEPKLNRQVIESVSPTKETAEKVLGGNAGRLLSDVKLTPSSKSPALIQKNR